MIPALEQYLANNLNAQVVIFEGVQNQAEILYAEDFLKWATQSPRVLFRAYLSREKLEQKPDYVHYGHLQTGFAELNLNPKQDFIYLCGNPAMIDEAFDMLQAQGFTTQQIVREKYISSTK